MWTVGVVSNPLIHPRGRRTLPDVAADLRAGRRARRNCAALWLLVTWTARAAAQATLELEVEADEVRVREPFLVNVRVNNFESCDAPDFPLLENASVRAQSGGVDSSQMLSVNGRMTVSRSRTYVFEVTPLAAGELAIPPAQVRVDGRMLQTKPARVVVRPSDAELLFWVEITCDRKRIYVGQRVRLTLTIWVKPVKMQEQLVPPDEMMGFLRVINFGPFSPREVRTDVRRRSSAGGGTETYYAYETHADYVPDRPGQLKLDDVEVAIQYPTRLSRDIFGTWQVRAARNLRARAQVESVEIVPLPTQGRPPHFTGAVGTYGITVSAEPTIVRVGDPIRLTIEIRGDGPIESVPPPDLAGDPRLTQSFRVPREELAGEVSGSRKRFTQIIRAERPDVTEIPALEYPYFDPDREMYVVALSAPIRLTVTPAAALDTSSLVDTSSPAANQNAAAPAPLDGLRGNKTQETELLAVGAPVRLDRLALVLFVPPAVYGLLWGYGAYVQNCTPAQRRRRSALRTARRRIDQARALPPRDCGAEIAAALNGYLADRLDEPAARFVGNAATAFLDDRRVPAPLCARWVRLLGRCEQASFGGMTDGDTAALADEARECLRALERERL